MKKHKEIESRDKIMEEIYKDIKISYNELWSRFEFDIETTNLMTSTLDQAKTTIDNYLNAKTLVGKKVIGFRSQDGTKIISEITRLFFDEPERVHSGHIRIYFIDKNNADMPTIGPFMEYNEENEAIADQITSARLTIRCNYEKIKSLTSIAHSKRADKTTL
jgi:hypothetical protein